MNGCKGSKSPQRAVGTACKVTQCLILFTHVLTRAELSAVAGEPRERTRAGLTLRTTPVVTTMFSASSTVLVATVLTLLTTASLTALACSLVFSATAEDSGWTQPWPSPLLPTQAGENSPFPELGCLTPSYFHLFV